MAKIIKEDSALGATITDIDLKQPLDEKLTVFISKALAENEVKDFINTIEKKLKNKSFIDKAPENIVNNEKNKLNDFIVERDKIIDNIAMLK